MTFLAFCPTPDVEIVSSVMSSVWTKILGARILATVLRDRDRLLYKFITIMRHSRAIIWFFDLLLNAILKYLYFGPSCFVSWRWCGSWDIMHCCTNTLSYAKKLAIFERDLLELTVLGVLTCWRCMYTSVFPSLWCLRHLDINNRFL